MPAGRDDNEMEPSWQALYGVLKLTLRPRSYDWQFISITGKVLDSGSAVCH